MTLHILTNLKALEAFVKQHEKTETSTDDVLLIGDACYALQKPNDLKVLCRHNPHALEEDILQRGINQTTPSPSIPRIDYSDFVSLTESNKNSLTWY